MTLSFPERVIGTAYPARDLLAVEPVATGNRRGTAVVWFADARPVVVQWSPDIDALRVEAALCREIRDRTAVPVPQTHSVGTLDGVGYALREYRAGGDLHRAFTAFDSESRQRLVATFGRYLGDLHEAFRFDGAGPLALAESAGAADVDPATLVPTGDDDWQRAYGRRAVERLPAAFDPLRDRLRECLASASPASGPCRLFPWDLRPGNALVDGDAITAVVDWEAPAAATPALAAAKVAYLTAAWYDVETARLRGAFREGYESVRPWPAVGPADRVAAIADSAVDSRGRVTNPGYPEYGRERAIDWHRAALVDALGDRAGVDA